MENVEGGDNENIDLNDVRNPNGDEHQVQGQAQSGGKEDDVLPIPPLEEKNILIDVLHK